MWWPLTSFDLFDLQVEAKKSLGSLRSHPRSRWASSLRSEKWKITTVRKVKTCEVAVGQNLKINCPCFKEGLEFWPIARGFRLMWNLRTTHLIRWHSRRVPRGARCKCHRRQMENHRHLWNPIGLVSFSLKMDGKMVWIHCTPRSNSGLGPTCASSFQRDATVKRAPDF